MERRKYVIYYQRSESIASEHQELRDLILKIDKYLQSLVGRLFDVERMADILGEKPEKIKRIIDLYCESDDVEPVKVVLCPEDHEPIEPGNMSKQLFCDLCQAYYDEDDCKKEIWYRPLHAGADLVEIQKNECLKLPTELQEKIGNHFLRDPFQHSNLLSYFSSKIKDFPLKGKRIISLLHFLRDLIPFVEAMKQLGMNFKASHFYFKEYPYPQRDAIKEWLDEQGCFVRSIKDLERDLETLNGEEPERIGDILIIEDGGHIYPNILRKYPKLLKQVRGCVEQTTRGSKNIEMALGETECRENIPVLSVADSQLKREFEPPHVATAAVQNIKDLLPDMDFRGKNAGLIGFGAIGEKIALRLRDEGLNVTVWDKDDGKLLKAFQQGFEAVEIPKELAKKCFLIIGSTGNLTIGLDEILELRHGTYLVSVSSEQYEFCLDELKNLSGGREEPFITNGKVAGTKYIIRRSDNPEIFLLANGYPVNFWGMDSMPNQASDLILTLMLLSLVELARDNTNCSGISAERVDEITKKYELAKLYREMQQSN